MRKWIEKFFNKEPVSPFPQSTGKEGVIMIGYHARELIRNPAFDAAMKKIEEELIFAWKTSPPNSARARERIYYRMEGLAQIKLKLAGMVNNMLLEESMSKKERQSDEETR